MPLTYQKVFFVLKKMIAAKHLSEDMKLIYDFRHELVKKIHEDMMQKAK